MPKLVSNLFVILMVGSLIVACANRGTPQGGPKDEKPPVIVKSEPENYAINFKATEIKLYFDEYVKLKNLSKQLIISPPMNTMPEITPLSSASKYITIKIFDTLQPNTTYAFNFGNSIVDNNEENAFPFYRYVFSTGSYIDSLEVKGNVKDALLLNTDTFVSVMLYEADSAYTDSLVYKQLPKYITNTLDSTTTFTLSNLKAGKYKLIALKDQNQDNKYQQKLDKIGFIENYITVPQDTSYSLKLFTETPDFKAIRPKLLSGEKIAFGYEGDYRKTDIEITSVVPDSFAYRITKEKTTDTLLYWYKPRMASDSLLFKVSHPSGYQEDFTVRISEQKRDSLEVSATHSGTLHFEETFGIRANVPFEQLDFSKLRAIDKDSLAIDVTSRLDTLNNIYFFDFEKSEENTYSFQLLPGAVTDFFGRQNDTLNYTLKTKSTADYGNVRVTLKNATYPVIVQLTDKNGEVKREQYSTKPEPVDFTYVVPAKLFLRVIFDRNKNGRYDPGNYLLGIQPERVSYDSEQLDIRAGWDEVREFTLLE